MEGSDSPFKGWLYSRTGGRRGGKIDGLPVCLLTIRRKGSKQTKFVRVPYAIRGRNILLIAGSRGESKHPAWYSDIAAYPKIQIQIGRRVGRFTVRQAGDDEKEALWFYAAVNHRDFHMYYLPRYERFPLLICTPIDRRHKPRPGEDRRKAQTDAEQP